MGVLEKNPFRGGDMDVFWNYTSRVIVIKFLQAVFL